MGIEEEVWGWEDVYNSFIAKLLILIKIPVLHKAK